MKLLIPSLLIFLLLEASALTTLTNPAPEILIADNGDIHLNWEVLSSHSYDVYYSTNLTNPFELSDEDVQLPQTNYTDTTHRLGMCAFYKLTASLIGPTDVDDLASDGVLLQFEGDKYLYHTNFKYPLIQVEGPPPYSYMVGDHVISAFPEGVTYSDVQNWVNNHGYVIREYSAGSDYYLIQTLAAQLDSVYQIKADILSDYPSASVGLDYIVLSN